MRRYELRDDQWDRIKDMLPGREGSVELKAADNRLFVEAVFDRYGAGIPWRDLAERFETRRVFIGASAAGPNPVYGSSIVTLTSPEQPKVEGGRAELIMPRVRRIFPGARFRKRRTGPRDRHVLQVAVGGDRSDRSNRVSRGGRTAQGHRPRDRGRRGVFRSHGQPRRGWSIVSSTDKGHA
jgi:hypothetical protein